ncbi:FimV/HubP family polar landmark protein [Sphaerotilus mobilis]|uniref:Pilus assembly protein FimV n=1 Tax=Sphaerotilus mobilis TaxID=47994 RepID=A0A4Q7LWV0_9BURK|nr:FimV/HubP family polar landmark protein [Sphaerotilus mobilis]RZS58309.1 pilus assembly protein FimV [Sphaerotilus mobilis]
MALKQVAAAVALSALLAGAPSAWALSLGRLTVQSALGESLRAEIDVTSLTPEEAANLRVRIAPPDAYRIAGVDYNPVLPQTSVAVQRRPDGSAFLRISSNQSVQEPFVDVILELSWSSGRLLREYTLLFDPPATAKAPSAPAPAVAAAPPVPAAPPVAAAPAVPAAPPAPAPLTAAASAPDVAPAPAAQVAEAAPTAPAAALGKGELAVRGKGKARVDAPAAPAAPAPAEAASDAAASEVKVRAGDTLSSIARKAQPSGVSLDQMLVGLYQGNPQAFIGNNMNRLRSGVILNVPAGEQLSAIDAQEARRVIVAQSADFNAYRQRLASVVPAPVNDAAPARQGGGKVTAEVQDQKQPAATAQDRLKLDKGKPAAGKTQVASAEDKIAADRAAKEASDRASEMARNVEELKKLQAASASTPAAPAPTPAVASAPALPAPTLPVAKPAEAMASDVVAAASAPMVDTAASAASAADAALAAASAAMSGGVDAASAPASAPVPPAPVVAEEPSLLDGLAENPWVLPGAGVILALLAGLGYYRLRGRSKEDAGVTSFLESRLQPDSFFGASGGQRVDTRDASGAPSSMSYSLSQIDAIGDVDPVAEADVYLAYGRDLQAEEILKEAMRANPDRLAIRTKLLEVYAKRRDTKGYELLAGELYGLTGGQGEDWIRAQELGRSIDPDNPLYEPGGQPGFGSTAEAGGGEALGASTMPQSIVPSPSRFEHSVPDLDLSADPMGTPSAAVDLDISVPAVMDDPMPSSVSNTFPSVPSGFGSAPSAFDSRPSNGDFRGSASLDFELDDLPRSSSASASTPSIDLADLSLDLDTPLSRPGSIPAPLNVEAYDSGLGDDGSDPLARKLELAEEFNQIGDFEGARDLLQEVIDNADGTLRAKAQAMLDKLG